MRGWLSIFTKAGNLGQYRSCVFVASAEPDVIAKILPAVQEHFPQLSFTYLTSRAYAERFSSMEDAVRNGEVLWIESLKANPFRSLAALRKRRFDLCIVVWPGRPTFLMSKIAAFWLNTRRILVYNENGDSFSIDRSNWTCALAHARFRLRKFPSMSFFYPIGFTYLLGRTSWLYVRGKILTATSNRGERPSCGLS
jgi:hypothetical protein